MTWILRPSIANRLRAGGVHLLLTAALVGIVVAVGFFYWYPLGLAAVAGGLHVFALVAVVALAVGPLLTALVYVPGKKGLGFDLVTIAVVQLAALAYGAWALQLGRPAYVVFVAERFELLRAKDLDERRWTSRPGLLEGVQVVGTRLPANSAKRTELVIAAMSGLDLQHFPEYYVPYPAVVNDVLKAARPMAELRLANPQAAGRIDDLVAGLGRPEADLRFLAVRTGGPEAVAIVDAKDAAVLRFANLRPAS